jgi:hypothetical protein
MIGGFNMRYQVNAYLCTNFAGLMESLETDYWNEVEDFIWENVQRGYNCELTDNESGETNWAYADDFDEEALDPEDLIRDNKKTFYADLRMEQQEQM